jgi:REP element-mobilizing transposase RayT
MREARWTTAIMAHTYVSQLVHCVFSTKNRMNTIRDELRPELWSYIGGIARTNKMKAIAVGGTANHVHVLLSLPATVPLAKAMQLVKGGSSKWLHDKTGSRFEWQDSYGAFTVGVSQVKATIDYINSQAEHHAKRDFEDEFREFLKRHGIVFDEKYAFG